MNEAELYPINYSCVYEKVGSPPIDNNVSKMTNVILDPPSTSSTSQDDETSEVGENSNEMMSLEQVGSVDGAVPEVALSEDDKSETTIHNII